MGDNDLPLFDVLGRDLLVMRTDWSIFTTTRSFLRPMTLKAPRPL